ncbi:hypothetical protein D3C75_863500 [compost metagenome]
MPFNLGLTGQPLPHGMSIVAASNDGSVPVDGNKAGHTCCQQHLAYGGSRSPDPVDDNPDLLHSFAHHPQRIKQPCCNNDGGAMLVIMKHGNVQFFLKPPFNLEAAGRADVLKVDSSEDRADRLDDEDNFLRVLGVQTDGESIHIRKLLEQHRLALHDRSRCSRPDISKTEYGCSIRYHSNRISLDGKGIGFIRFVRNSGAYPGHTRRIHPRQIIPVFNRCRGPD